MLFDNVLCGVINEGGEQQWDWWVINTIREIRFSTRLLSMTGEEEGNLLFCAEPNRIALVMFWPRPSHRLTEAEYLEVERAAEFKSEFFEGEMFAMAGGTPQHSLIAINLAAEFRNRLKEGPCVP